MPRDSTAVTPRDLPPLDRERQRTDPARSPATAEGPLSVLCGDRPMLFGPGVDDYNELDDPC